MDLVHLITGINKDSPDEQMDYLTSGAATLAIAGGGVGPFGRDAAALAQKHGLTLAGANAFLDWDRQKNGRATVEDWVPGWWMDNPDAFVDSFAKFSAGVAPGDARGASSTPAPTTPMGKATSAVTSAIKVVTTTSSSVSPMLLPALGILSSVAIAYFAIKHSSSNAAVKL